ncbi:hypothetical protein I6N95_11640 [Vagococcus sp. BWB3-3]|uniref:Ethanolamine utilization protein EutP n=1 Tax=Vagococcus allomyrinae TaxID=2794353 RepID=A0A940P5Z4_9ENTE|nr:EutP/PduV family microcompartment system protein [Vagococcus allomyrinae]MBP1041660.1 hypothetical protein [Vagococcus allomyrinae]
MRKQIMIIGAQGSGKSSVANWLNETEKPLKKRQDAIYGQYTLDIPAGYLENPSMYRYIFSLSQTAGLILLLANGKDTISVFPPNFAKSFPCPVVGMVRGTNEEEKMFAEEVLQAAGVTPPYFLFDLTNRELADIRRRWVAQLDD